MKKLIVIFLITIYSSIYSQNYTSYVVGKYSVTASWNNGINNCPSILNLIQNITGPYPNTVRETDSCFVNQWTLSEPWAILVNADSTMLEYSISGTNSVVAIGKLYANDSIYLKVKNFANTSLWRTFKGFKLYSTVAKADELSLPENALLFSPNPESDIMYIQSTQQNFINEPVLYDLKGAKINTEINYVNSHTYKVDVSSLPNGIYFVFVQTNQGYLKKKVMVSK
jgi:hypothetical protein